MPMFSKKILSFLLILFLSFSSSISFCESTFEPQKYKSTQLLEESLEINIENNNLFFTKIPKDSNFNFIWVKIKNGTNSSVVDNIYSKEDLLNNHKSISVNNLPNGKYYIEIFNAPEHYTTYSSYIYDKKLSITISDNTASFSTPIVYNRNESIIKSKRTDEYALLYYTEPSLDIQSDNPEIIKLSKEITSGLENDYDKAKAIHDWVCKNIWYDFDAYKGNSDYGDTSALGTLRSKKSVCQGYASLTAALLRASEIPAKFVIGNALGIDSDKEWSSDVLSSNETNHAWNEVYIDSRWISIDTTWDSDNVYENGKFSTGTGLSGYTYFDPTISSFSLDHMLVDYQEEISNWWIDEDKNEYYVNDKGLELKGLHKIDGLKYYFNSSGVMQKGWQTINGKKYYFNKDGAMAQNITLVIDGKKYIFDANGNSKIKKK